MSNHRNNQRLFIGSKMIMAIAMTRLQYNELRGWDVPSDENPDDAGFLVEYLDGGKANVEGFAGYVSWSPADVFDRAYRDVRVGMSFGDALELLKAGKRVSRAGWNGKGQFLFLVPGSTFTVNRAPLLGIYPEGTSVNYHPHIDLKNAQGLVVPWAASQGDMLAEDWVLVDSASQDDDAQLAQPQQLLTEADAAADLAGEPRPATTN